MIIGYGYGCAALWLLSCLKMFNFEQRCTAVLLYLLFLSSEIDAIYYYTCATSYDTPRLLKFNTHRLARKIHRHPAKSTPTPLEIRPCVQPQFRRQNSPLLVAPNRVVPHPKPPSVASLCPLRRRLTLARLHFTSPRFTALAARIMLTF